MTTSCPNLTPEQRAAAMPWGIASAAAMILEFAIMISALCHMMLVKGADYRIGGTCIIGSLLLRHMIVRICADRIAHLTGIEPHPGAAWPWRKIIFYLVAGGAMIGVLWRSPSFRPPTYNDQHSVVSPGSSTGDA